MIKLKINVPNVKPYLTIQTTCLIVKQIQPAFPLPAFGPTLSKLLISLDGKNSKILTKDEATTTTIKLSKILVLALQNIVAFFLLF